VQQFLCSQQIMCRVAPLHLALHDALVGPGYLAGSKGDSVRYPQSRERPIDPVCSTIPRQSGVSLARNGGFPIAGEINASGAPIINQKNDHACRQISCKWPITSPASSAMVAPDAEKGQESSRLQTRIRDGQGVVRMARLDPVADIAHFGPLLPSNCVCCWHPHLIAPHPR
jgi:hypothetical protein